MISRISTRSFDMQSAEKAGWLHTYFSIATFYATTSTTHCTIEGTNIDTKTAHTVVEDGHRHALPGDSGLPRLLDAHVQGRLIIPCAPSGLVPLLWNTRGSVCRGRYCLCHACWGSHVVTHVVHCCFSYICVQFFVNEKIGRSCLSQGLWTSLRCWSVIAYRDA